MYVITRNDLHAGSQCAQSIHSVVEFGIKNPEAFKEWNENSNYIVTLSVKNELHLNEVIEKCKKIGIEYYEFFEPDFDNELTSITLLPSSLNKKVVSNLPLLLKNYNDINERTE